jgi:adenylyl-sulfate kinase
MTPVDKAARAALKGQRPACVWLTGLPGSGKSTLAQALERSLAAQGRHTYVLDGDHLRSGLNRDLGFTAEARAENIRRAAEVAKLAFEHGHIALCSFISPYQRDRDLARSLILPERFLEIFVKCDLAVCQRRDHKGLYERAIRGEIKNFTGVTSPYEEPLQPELVIETDVQTPEEAVEQIITTLARRGIIHI